MSITAYEQYLIELINRARLDPEAEAARQGIDLNAGITGTQLTGESRQVLAPDALISAAAEAHSQWMYDNDTFSHYGENGSTPRDRIEAAGYVFEGYSTTGENISYVGSSAPLDLKQAIEAQHAGLWESTDHRINMLDNTFREVGVGQVVETFTSNGYDYEISMVTEKFVLSGPAHFLTGVAYDDSNGNDFYDPGEGIAGVQVSANAGGGGTLAAGGYAVSVTPGAVTGTLTALSGQTRDYSADLGTGNGKLDLSWSGDTLRLFTSVSLSLGGGDLAVGELRALGLDGVALTGSAGAEMILGNAGNDTLSGGDQRDSIKGGDGDDLIDGGSWADNLTGAGGNDTVTGGLGTDTAWMGAGDDVFHDDAQHNSWGTDTVWGGNGNDTINGGGGSDVFHGNNGRDNIYGGKGGDRIDGGTHADLLSGQNGNDTVTGGLGPDKVYLGDGNDLFLDTAQAGSYGTDTVFGGAGDDTIQSAGGDDRMTGAAGADSFVFLPGAGTMRITDYATALDSLQIHEGHLTGVTDAESFAARTEVVGGDLVIDFDGASTLTLDGVADAAGLWEDITLFSGT